MAYWGICAGFWELRHSDVSCRTIVLHNRKFHRCFVSLPTHWLGFDCCSSHRQIFVYVRIRVLCVMLAPSFPFITGDLAHVLVTYLHAWLIHFHTTCNRWTVAGLAPSLVRPFLFLFFFHWLNESLFVVHICFHTTIFVSGAHSADLPHTFCCVLWLPYSPRIPKIGYTNLSQDGLCLVWSQTILLSSLTTVCLFLPQAVQKHGPWQIFSECNGYYGELCYILCSQYL